ncbi:hypothetical protein V6Z11_1Z094300 [Gossypium hirsutum]
MAMVSMKFFVPSLNSPNLRPTKRYSGMAVAASNQDAVALGVTVTQGEGNLPKLLLTSDHGSEAEIYLFGGCITSWKVPSGETFYLYGLMLYLTRRSQSVEVFHIVSHSFGPGLMQQHGFARNMDWSLVESENVEGNPNVTLELKDGPYSRAMWDFSFQARYKVVLNTKSLSTELKVTNTDNKPFTFSTALHSYFRASITRGIRERFERLQTLNKILILRIRLRVGEKGMPSLFLDL